MHAKMKKLPAALAAAALLATPFAFAQQTPVKIEKIEVTGSNIKRVDAEGPVPVLILNKADIERSGKATVSDLLRELPMANLGNFSESTAGGNTSAPGTAGVSLRGLGTNTTLVLLNGRRIANYGFAQNNTAAFVDLNSIPISAIERVEILKDGASAIYGSDAIAGVVNIILRKDFKGIEASSTFGKSSAGDGQEQRYTLTGGFGDLAKDRFNVMGMLDFYKRDPIWAGDRSFSANANYTSAGGLDLRSPTGNPGRWRLSAAPVPVALRSSDVVFPTCPADQRGLSAGQPTCFFNFQPFVYLLPPSERKGAFVRSTFDFNSNVSAFLEASYNKNETTNQLAPTPGTVTLPIGHNSNPYPFAVSISYRFTDVGPRIYQQISDTKRVVGGFKGAGYGWDWETGYNWSRNNADSLNTNFISQTAFDALAAANVYNFLNPSVNSPSLVNGLRASPFRLSQSKLDAFDARASRELMQLPAGPLGIAVGAEHRKESIVDTPDALSAQFLIVGSGGTSSKGDRSLTSAYAELSVPVVKNIEAQVAVRTDSYSDFGRATKPKLALSWKPANNVLVRGSYAEGFRAPSLVELFLGSTVSFPAFVDTPRCTAYRAAYGNTDARSVSACGSNQVRTSSEGNKLLDAEKSKSYNVGVVWDFTPEFNMTLDKYRIVHSNRIAQPSVAFQLSNESAFPNTIFRQGRTAADIAANAPGALFGVGSDINIGLIRSYFNLTKQETEGIDLELRYRMNLGEYGKLNLKTLNTYMITLERQLAPGQAPVEIAGTNEVPRTISVNSATWNKGEWEAGLTTRTRSKYRQVNQIARRDVASFTTADTQFAYTGIKNLKLAFGINNLADKAPPFDDNANDGYSNSTDSPIGRYFYGRAVWSFK